MMRSTILSGLLALFLVHGASGATIFAVDVDTSSVSGQSGTVFFQFNPGLGTAGIAVASVDGVSTDGTPGSVLDQMGAVSGSLTGMVTLENSGFPNFLLQGFTFGSFFRFTVGFSGPAIGLPSGDAGSAFGFSVYGPDGVTPILGSADPLVQVDLDTQGVLTASSNDSLAMVEAVTTAIPEPGTIGLSAVALVVLGIVRSQRA